MDCFLGDGKLITSVWVLRQTLQTMKRRTLWLTSLRRRETHHERRGDRCHCVPSFVAWLWT